MGGGGGYILEHVLKLTSCLLKAKRLTLSPEKSCRHSKSVLANARTAAILLSCQFTGVIDYLSPGLVSDCRHVQNKDSAEQPVLPARW